MKQLVKLISLLMVIGLFAGFAVASEGGNPKKGKYLWKKNCKSCHVEGKEGGVVSPSSKTQDQWEKYFEGSHDGAANEKCKKFSDSDLHDIQHYMNDHAVDSDQPETCG